MSPRSAAPIFMTNGRSSIRQTARCNIGMCAGLVPALLAAAKPLMSGHHESLGTRAMETASA